MGDGDADAALKDEPGEADTETPGNRRLSLLLAAAMFVLVVDTSLMNVSISAVVDDLDTTVSGVQAAIALEALVSAAFILISSKIGDLIGRKRAYVLGLLGYAIGALAMTLAQSLTAIIVFWAIIGGLGASLLLPAMQSLIHGNFEGAAQREDLRAGRRAGRDRRRGRAAARRLRHHLPLVARRLPARGRHHRGRPVADRADPGRPVHGDAEGRRRRRGPLRRSAWAASCSASSSGRRAASTSALLIAIGALALWALACWLVRRKREGKATLLDPDLFRFPHFRIGITGQMLQQITLGGAMIALPIFLQMTLEYNALEAGLSLAPLSLTMFAVAILAGRKAGKRRPASIIRAGFALSTLGLALIIPIVPDADSGWASRRPAGDRGRGARPARVAAQQLHAGSDRRGAGQRGGRRQLGGGFVRPLVRPRGRGRRHAGDALARLHQHDEASPRDPATEQQQIAETLEDDAEVMSNTQLEALLVGEPPDVQDEILSINTDAPNLALQVALLVPILAGLVGLFNALPHDAPTRRSAVSRRRSSGLGLTFAGNAPPSCEILSGPCRRRT